MTTPIIQSTTRAALTMAAAVAVLAGMVLNGPAPRAAEDDLKEAIFAGGCFWCVEADFDKVPGVVETISGYTGGHVKDPSYEQVSAGGTGHYESVKIVYDPDTVTYEDLLYTFWRSVDPTDPGGQFCDRGNSYRTAIFAVTERQEKLAKASKQKLQESGVLDSKIVTPVLSAGPFYRAEGYHQNYYKKNPIKYNYYRWRCGRDDRVEELWGDEAHAGMAGH